MSFRAYIRQAAHPIMIDAGETLLQAALRQGIPYPHSCTTGRCGACKSHLLSGEVDLLSHTRFALTEDEKVQGTILACRTVPKSDIAVSWVDAMEPEVTQPTSSGTAVVRSIDFVAPGVCRLVLVPLFPTQFLPGQFFRLTFPGAPPRPYSPSSQPEAPSLEFHVSIVRGGAASTALTNRLQRGDEVGVAGPFGSAYLREAHDGPILAAGAGTGVSPIISIVERALKSRSDRAIHLLLTARTVADLYIRERVQRLQDYYPNLSVVTVLTREQGQEPIRLPTIIETRFHQLEGWKVHVAGPPDFVEATALASRQKGARSFDIHADPFTPQAQGHAS